MAGRLVAIYGLSFRRIEPQRVMQIRPSDCPRPESAGTWWGRPETAGTWWGMVMGASGPTDQQQSPVVSVGYAAGKGVQISLDRPSQQLEVVLAAQSADLGQPVDAVFLIVWITRFSDAVGVEDQEILRSQVHGVFFVDTLWNQADWGT